MDRIQRPVRLAFVFEAGRHEARELAPCAWLEQNHLWRIAAVLINLSFVLHAHRRPPLLLLLIA
eukprot:jgi/Chrpa1/13468/Chrysochromulina_OHIO_Genome00018529-RA